MPYLLFWDEGRNLYQRQLPPIYKLQTPLALSEYLNLDLLLIHQSLWINNYKFAVLFFPGQLLENGEIKYAVVEKSLALHVLHQ